jgi:DNA-binding PadR family transcriptional regulator
MTPAVFHILLALAGGNLHGYAIMQEVQRRTDGRIDLGPGTLYRSIGKMLDAGLITEVADPADTDSSRRRYRITRLGRRAAADEVRHLDTIVRWAESVRLFERREPA